MFTALERKLPRHRYKGSSVLIHNYYITRMHSSRMRTARFSGCLGLSALGRGVCLGLCVCPKGGGLPRGCLPKGCLPRGVHPLPIACYDTPSIRITDKCKNITFPRIRLRAVKIMFSGMYYFLMRPRKWGMGSFVLHWKNARC